MSDRVDFLYLNSLNMILFSQLTRFGKLAFFKWRPSFLAPDGFRRSGCIGCKLIFLTDVGSITLTEMWHVPNIGGNLISVSRMVDAGFYVEFGPTTCTVNQGGTRSNLGQRVRNLYYLNKELVSNTESFTEVAKLGLSTNQFPIATIETWHKRHGHRTLNATAMAYISSKVANMEIRGAGKPTPTICGTCAIGRQHKEAGTKTREKAKEVLEVVHLDVRGPMQTPELSDER